MLAGAPLVGRSAAQVLAKQAAAQYSGGELVGSGDVSTSGYATTDAIPTGPKMQQWQAYRLAMNVPEIRQLMLDAAQNECRAVTGIDPDIEVLRSLSPMAKITFQRQRNVQRRLEEAMEEPKWSWAQKGHDYISKLMWGNS